MAYRLQWTVYGDRLVEAEFSRFVRGVSDFRPVFDDIQADLENRIVPQTFESRGGRAGRRWPPLSPKYAAWKARRYPGRPMMVLRGKLLGSLTGQTGDSIRRKRRKEFAFGTKLVYGPAHHHGTDRLPKRRFLALRPRDQVDWGKMVHRFAIRLMGRLRE